MIALIFLTAAAVYVVIGGLILKRISSSWLKGLVVAILILIPTGDEIAGHLYFNHLCNTEAGVKVYQTVELPAEYWDAQGNPKFFNDQGYLDRKLLADKLMGEIHSEPYQSILGIEKSVIATKEKSTKRVLASTTTFLFWGGWVVRNFSPHNTAASCAFMDEPSFNRDLYGRLFKAIATTR